MTRALVEKELREHQLLLLFKSQPQRSSMALSGTPLLLFSIAECSHQHAT
jgi:hypothetical protein